MGWFWCTVGAAALLYCGAVRLLAGKMAFAAVPAVGGAFSVLLGLGMLRFPGNLVLGWISGIGVLGICILTALEAGILLRARRLSTPAGKPDCTVILGCGLRDGERASRTMLERLEKAFSVWEGEPIILSGGQSEREKYPEAAVMARWLAGKGVPPEKLLQEGRSRNTVQNLRYSREMIEAEIGRPVGQLRVRIVTNGFHAPRALSIARALGYAKAWAVPARTGGLAAPLYHLRECLSQPVWWMRRWKMKKMERGTALKTGNKLPSFVAVPADIIDKHLKTASGAYLKVVLYVLRQNEIDIRAAAEALGLPESDIEEALRYWVTAGILPEAEVSAAVARGRKPEPKPPVIASPEAMTAGEFSELSGREEVKFLLTTAEQLMGRPLSSTEQKGYVFFLEEYGLPADVIVMAIDFCCMHDRKNYRYIAKMLTGWHDEGINTHPLAEEYIRTQSARLSREGEVVEAFGLEKRGLTTSNRKQIAHWYQDLGYNIEMIRMAYERTVDQIGQVSFPYINKILENWHALGLKTPEEVLTGDTPRRGKNGQGNPSFDLDAFSRQGFDLVDMDDHS